MNRRRPSVLAAVAAAALMGSARAGAVGPAAILFTGDTQGHVGACQSCPGPSGRGGLDRRATLLRTLMADHPGSVVVDAGDALFGEDSLASGGAVVAAAYGAMGYGVVNLGPGDFRQGVGHTLDLLRAAKLTATSANLLDAGTGRPLADPVVVVRVGDRRVALVGVAEPPAGLDLLPRLKRQLTGVRFRPPAEALAEWLPKAGGRADAVVVLYDGSATGLRAVRTAVGDRAVAILAAGAGEAAADLAGTPPVVTVESHGRAIGVVTLGGGAVTVDHEPVLASLAADPTVAAVLARYAPPELALPPPTATAVPPAARDPRPTVQPASPLVATDAATPPPLRTTTATAGPSPSAAHPARPTPLGLAGVGLTADRVNAAVDRGSAALWSYLQAHDLAAGQRFGSDPSHVLSALALVHCDFHRRSPSFDATVRAYLRSVDPYAVGTYQCGLAAQLVEAYGDPAFDGQLRRAARYLLEAQGADGTWNYGVRLTPPVDDGPSAGPLRVVGGEVADPVTADALRWRRATPWDPAVTGDNSASQFALLGLSAAARSHVPLPTDLWRRALDACRRRRGPDGGWAYVAPPAAAYGSMTCAGICATAICRHELGDGTDDPGIAAGLGWLDARFAADRNPAATGWDLYYLYSLERVGRVLDTEFVGGHEWYPPGARHLLDVQRPDGTWVGQSTESDPRIATAFALLFLTRSTPTLAAAPRHGGPGLLMTEVATPPPRRVYVILDASGSMLDEMGGRPKFDVARDAVATLVAALPDRTPLALRVYGHRKRSTEPGSDQDTALEMPMAALDRAAVAAKLEGLRPRGKTPLALSLEDAAKDLAGVTAADPVTLVLLTDGGEDTWPRRDPVAAAAALGRLRGVRLCIVGFDIHDPGWGTQLHAMAAAAGGDYWPAVDGPVLARQVRSAVLGIPGDFAVADAEGHAVARGQFGDRKTLPEGQYALTATYAERPYRAEFHIATEATTGLLFDATAVVPDPARPLAAAGVARFCIHCGHRLPARSKFCPACGAAVGPP